MCKMGLLFITQSNFSVNVYLNLEKKKWSEKNTSYSPNQQSTKFHFLEIVQKF